MTISNEIRDMVRGRAGFACEYCGVSEVDSGGMLTVDHFKPLSKGGMNALFNLIYCCFKCNLFKHQFFNDNNEGPHLWNPREGLYFKHFLPLENGRLQGLTDTGEFTVSLLNLNRPQLIAHRFRKFQRIKEKRLLEDYQNYFELINKVLPSLGNADEEMHRLRKTNLELLKIILSKS
ncbi:MAG TPA: HNH endonuclease [Bacteroidetes bacterium]|nr:HNH endonuclease [Bacteroidota bacterium]